MTHRLKTLGLALVAVLALGVTAGSASAAEFHSEVENTTLRGEQIGFNNITVSTGKVECEVATYAGAVSGTKTTSEITLAPTFEECTLAGQQAIIHMNGCVIRFTGNGGANILCPGNSIEITGNGCVITIPGQTLGGTTDYTNGTSTGKKDVTVTYTVTGMRYIEHGAKCAMSSSTVETTNGTINGSLTLKGFTSLFVVVNWWFE